MYTLNYTLKRTALPLFLIWGGLGCIVLWQGCSANELEVDFTLNEQGLKPYEAGPMPTNPNDTLHVYKTRVGDTVYLRDITKPEKKVKSRQWTVNDRPGQNTKYNLVKMEHPGWHKITLHVNKQEHSAVRWIYAAQSEPGNSSSAEPGSILPDPPPSPSPRAALPPKPFEGKPGKAGLSLSSYDPACARLSGSRFTATLKVKRELELGSFMVFTNQCGGMEVSFSGKDINERFRVGLVPGATQIALGANIPRLKAGTYQLEGRAFSQYAGCTAADAPQFMSVEACPSLRPITAAAMELTHQKTTVLHELKFTY
ncbi:hypothetical protein [Phaeodactylibacter xiamenensis]|uniref:hypothetical protein n=1 Tax=Phaeodactylibacter xiamenensis TaxID=1524460 RepID=UPI0024A936F1|nr:hypothetical protein [Phaeodactylibacter xiamenensis]